MSIRPPVYRTHTALVLCRFHPLIYILQDLVFHMNPNRSLPTKCQNANASLQTLMPPKNADADQTAPKDQRKR